MTRLVALIAVVAALVAPPAAALAQQNPFLQEDQQQQQAPSLQEGPPPPAPVEARDDGDGMSPAVGIALGVAVLLVIGGIWFAITRDARQAAPERRRAHTARTEPDAQMRSSPGSRGRHHTRSTRHRKPSRKERERRKRGRAR